MSEKRETAELKRKQSNRFTRRTGRSRQTDHTLQASASRRRSRSHRESAWRVLRLVLIPALVIAIPVLLLTMVQTFYFSRNPFFTLQQIVIHTGDTVSEASVREITGIQRGQNLFAIDIDALRRQYLSHAHYVRNIQFTRVLPDRLEIRLTERHPVARIGREGDLVVDAQGLVFVRRGERTLLPMLVGGRRARSGNILVVSETLVPIEPGKRLTGNARAGIEAILLNDEPGFQLPLIEVDVSRLDFIVLLLDDRREVKLAWEGMGAGTPRSRRALKRRMQALRLALAKPQSREKRYFDATIDDQHIVAR